jgi:hypothetical protein
VAIDNASLSRNSIPGNWKFAAATSHGDLWKMMSVEHNSEVMKSVVFSGCKADSGLTLDAWHRAMPLMISWL